MRLLQGPSLESLRLHLDPKTMKNNSCLEVVDHHFTYFWELGRDESQCLEMIFWGFCLDRF